MTGINNIYEKLKRYEELGTAEKNIKEEKEDIRKSISKFMHDQDANEIKLKIDETNYWSCKYQKRTNSVFNKDLLFEDLGEEKYKKYIDEKSSFSLNIRKMKNKKETSVPKNIAEKLNKIETPTGTVT